MDAIEIPKPVLIAVAVLVGALLIGGIWWRTGVHQKAGEDNRRIIAQETADQLRSSAPAPGQMRETTPGGP